MRRSRRVGWQTVVGPKCITAADLTAELARAPVSLPPCAQPDHAHDGGARGMAEADGAAAGAAGAATPHYEYLDHTADIQVHSWGKDLQESFANQVVAMFGYMTELDKVDIDEACTVEFEVEGEDACSLLYTLLDEFLFRFSAEDFMVCKEVRVLEFDAENWRMKVQGKGEAFDLTKHPQGTEVKAITYSAMQVHANKSTHDVYVILDI